jgi:hypothetical protein
VTGDLLLEITTVWQAEHDRLRADVSRLRQEQRRLNVPERLVIE